VTDDDLRAALAAADPVRSTDLHADDLDAAGLAPAGSAPAGFDPVTSPRARELLERIMASPTTEPSPATEHSPSTEQSPTTEPSRTTRASPTRITGTGSSARPAAAMRRPWLAAAAAAVVLGGGGAAYLASSDEAAPGGSPGRELALALPGGDPALQSCLPVSAEVLAPLPVAFAGTATAVADGEVRLEVDRWYRGGDATTVLLRNPGRRLRRWSAPPTSGSARTTWCPPTRAP
jgi:hypothetical protein